MSEKDVTIKVLKTGESRKDGRYLYKYIDSFGEVQFVYKVKLIITDRVPAGKRISLREKCRVTDIHLL